jgi:hypothetical protein
MPSSYTVTIYASRMPLPISFTFHAWVTITGLGKTDRFDLMGFIRDGQGERNGHIYKNYNPPTLGCPVLAIGAKTFWYNHLSWRSQVVYQSSGEEGSVAHRAYVLLHDRLCEYPFIQSPFGLVRGPSCNTFVGNEQDRDS